MPNPKKILKAVTAGKKAAQRRQTNRIQKNSVKVKPSRTAPKAAPKTAPKTGLENRGARLTRAEQGDRARALQWDKAEKAYDAGNEMAYTGLRSYPKGFEKSRPQGPKGKNLRKREGIAKEAKKKPLIKINSNPMRGK